MEATTNEGRWITRIAASKAPNSCGGLEPQNDVLSLTPASFGVSCLDFATLLWSHCCLGWPALMRC